MRHIYYVKERKILKKSIRILELIKLGKPSNSLQDHRLWHSIEADYQESINKNKCKARKARDATLWKNFGTSTTNAGEIGKAVSPII